jgi:hypothetical protein
VNEDEINGVSSLKSESNNEGMLLSDQENKCSGIIANLTGILTML